MMKQGPLGQHPQDLPLTRDELSYLQHAINDWKASAEEWIKHLEQNASQYYDEDHYDPMPPGKCIYLTQNQVTGAVALAKEIEKTWLQNGAISRNQFSRVLRVSIHTDMQNPLLLSIQNKYQPPIKPASHSAPSQQAPVTPIVESDPIKPLLFSKESVKSEVEAPDELCCPITMELFEDPYFDTLSVQTYSKSGLIEHYQRSGRSPNNAPLDGRKIEDVIFPDNVMALKVKAFKERHGLAMDSSTASLTKLKL